MLERILKMLENGSVTEELICLETGISHDEAKACIVYLELLGYIRPVKIQSGCSGGCKGCPQERSCGIMTNSTITWELTSKMER